MIQLVVTPRPKESECFLGYILRLSEANGYHSPGAPLLFVGLPGNRMFRAYPKVAEFAEKFSLPCEELLPLAVTGDTEGRKPVPVLRGHRLIAGQLREQGRICPACVREKGYIEAHWGLQLMVACPEHRCFALSKCPDCGNKLSWLRPGPGRCACGSHLSKALPDECAPGEAALLGLICNKLYSRPHLSNDHGFPAELFTMSMRGVLAIVTKLGRPVHVRKCDNREAEAIVRSAANLLADWPNGLLRHLEVMTDRGRRFVSLLLSGTRATHMDANEAEVIRRPLLDYVERTWGVKTRGSSNIVHGTSGKTGGRRSNRSQRLAGSARDRAVARGDLASYMAAQYLGVPDRALDEMVARGWIASVAQAGSPGRFDVQELDRIGARIRGACVAQAGVPEDSISIGAVLRWMPGQMSQRVEIISRLMNGEIQGYASEAIHIEDMTICRSQALREWEDIRSGSLKAVTINRTAAALGCSIQIIEPLADSGFLTWADSKRRRVSDQSIKEFRRNYIFVKELAKECKTKVWRLVTAMQERDMPVVVMERKRTKRPQAFISREHGRLAVAIFGTGGLGVPKSIRRAKIKARRGAEAAAREVGLAMS